MRKCIEIKSLPEEHEKVEKPVLKALTDSRCDEHTVFSVKLALEEAVMNAIQHGNKMDPTKKVKISYHLDDERIEICVEDEGSGFDPNDIPDCTEDERLENPYGRGIFLMRSFMDKVHYNELGNKVILEKKFAKG
jgi:serine/threonine-protein kinase RsbW